MTRETLTIAGVHESAKQDHIPFSNKDILGDRELLDVLVNMSVWMIFKCRRLEREPHYQIDEPAVFSGFGSLSQVYYLPTARLCSALPDEPAVFSGFGSLSQFRELAFGNYNMVCNALLGFSLFV
ncbi:hypothetical protein CTI12_AA550770 [Artemisia annua]|uniref:Uncharacterized protein n=1 Tax=Artemisia annua TaxID=35608 RepID=A0A2U1KYG7_ARTAN|nr:hypothetical protein CTI12_AA550770 [Artemisia annua]